MINVMTTFWRFLNEHTIEIPIIQRDYAQGRLGKEELRKNFLKDLKQALDSCKPLKLDFVYGAVESGKLNPLDGQQRLTTLWLLHWYLAYMAGAMNKDVKRVLAKFTYETRISSREFCRCLTDFDKLPPPGTDVVGHIQNQTWFRSAWNDDPTIQSMLRMLGGTAHNDNDGIEGVFHSCYDGECIECRLDQCPYSNAITYGEYWKRLIGTDCPIIFYSLDIHGINQTDDLYIKMNARGKPLTSFENFKADLVGYISRQAAVTSNAGNSCDKLNDPETGLAIKMDTNWMDIFWRNRSSDNAVDDIYFAFLNRYFFNVYVLQFEKTGDLQKAEDPIFDFLYGRKDGENEKIVYLGFDEIFRKVLNKDDTLLERLYNTLDNFSKFYTTQDKGVFSLFDAPWNCEKEDVEKFRFIPHYIGKESIIDFAGNRIRKIARITQPQRVVFHAVCKFFAQGWDAEAIEKEKAALRDWMRVVWNIVENANVDTISGMVGCLRLIDQLSEHSHNILDAFAKDFVPSSSFAKDQVSEEIEKARKILAGGAEWEKKIVCAENYAFFHGAIRFLFHDEAGKEKWDDFDAKWVNAQSYFNTNGVTETFRKNSLLLRALLARIDKLGEITEGFWFGNGANFWRNQVLLNVDVNSIVSELLLTEVTRDNAILTNTPDWIADNALLSDAIEKDNDSNGQWHIVTDWFRIGDKDKTLTRYANRIKGNVNYPGQIIPLGNLLRNELLVGLESEQRIGKRYFIGWTSDINFLYNSRWFQWYGTPSEGECDIYLLKNDWKNQIDPYEQHQEDPDKRGDERTYYCFKVDAAETKDSFRDKLNTLIKCAGKQ